MVKAFEVNLLRLKLNKELSKLVLIAQKKELRDLQMVFGNALNVKQSLHQTHIT